MGEDSLVLQVMVVGDAAAVARADRAERPVVLAHRHRVQAGSCIACIQRAVADLCEQVAKLPELAAKHVVDLDEVLPWVGQGDGV